MDHQTRRVLKVYLRLGWVKLNTYYSGLTAMAYPGALVMNPFKKTAVLRILWSQQPRNQAKKWSKDYLDELKDTRVKRYKERKIESPIEELGTVDLGDSIQLLEQLAAIDGSRSTTPQPQHHKALRDELERYLEEASADPTSYSGNSLAWWREVGSKKFPRLSYLDQTSSRSPRPPLQWNASSAF
jgi:hypothetical protein